MLSSVALAAAFYIAWANFGRRQHALTWALAYVVGALQFGAILNSQSFPSETARKSRRETARSRPTPNLVSQRPIRP